MRIAAPEMEDAVGPQRARRGVPRPRCDLGPLASAVLRRGFPRATPAPIRIAPSRRLRKRGTSNEEQIEERLGNARRSFGYAPDYDLVIDNDDGRLEQAVASIRAVL